MVRWILGLLLTVGLTMGAYTADGETYTWREDVRGWFIGVDRTIGDGCYMVSIFEGGTRVRAHFHPGNETFAFVVGDPDWRSIEGGKYYPMSVQFGNRSPWTGNGLGWWWDQDLPSIIMEVPFSDADRVDNFIEEFMRMTSVRVSYQGSVVAHLSLSGTFAAMLSMFECQSEMMSGTPEGIDPFSSTPRGGPDPFR